MTDVDINKDNSNDSTNKPEKQKRGTLVDMKNGKLVFKQKPMSFEKMSETLQEIVQFREMLEQRIQRNNSPLDTFPEQFKPLVAKLVHESDKTLQALSKYIQNELLPTQDDDDDEQCTATHNALPIEVVEKAITSVCTRNNFGLSGSFASGKIPASWHVWRWEVKDKHLDWLPKAAKEKAASRSAERLQAREDVKSLFESLPASDKDSILGVKNTNKPVAKDIGANTKGSKDIIDVDSSPAVNQSPSKSKKQKEKETSENIAEDVEGKKSVGRPKKAIDPEKVAKEKEKQEKKNAKVEREKREQEAQSKSRSLLANFFKPKVATPTKSKSGLKSPAGSSSTALKPQSDFDRTFKPFTLKKGAELAPSPWERYHRRRSPNLKGKTVIVIDDEDDSQCPDIEMSDVHGDREVGQMSRKERLHDAIKSLQGRSHIRARPLKRTHLKSWHPTSVRTVVAQLNEAEISGDDILVRSLLARLRNRSLFPIKVLIFDEDARPGYFGTWTRNSAEVGPRTPFSRDVVSLDYTYDSGEEWEEESGDADDVVEDVEEEDGGDDRDSDMESWLVDDDEVEEPGTPIEDRDRDSSPEFPQLNFPATKRKTKDVEVEKTSKRRKVVIPLVAYVKGPCWEKTVENCEYEPFKQYRMQFLHDSTTPINPFTYVCPLPDEKAAQLPKNTTAASSSSSNFAVPALPGRLGHSNASHTSAPVPNTPTKRPTLTPKTTFPDAHIPLLLSKITSLDTGTIAGIVETVFQELRPYKVKKNAIEAKVKEVAEKSREKKVWVVKPEFLVQ